MLAQKSSPRLNADFFGDTNGSDYINKDHPSMDNMSISFRELLLLLDAYLPKARKINRKRVLLFSFALAQQVGIAQQLQAAVGIARYGT